MRKSRGDSDNVTARIRSRAAALPELLALARGLVARFGGSDAPEIVAARGWLDGHCRGCAVPITEGRRDCGDCRRVWKRRRAEECAVATGHAPTEP